jgi:hypothetical protein
VRVAGANDEMWRHLAVQLPFEQSEIAEPLDQLKRILWLARHRRSVATRAADSITRLGLRPGMTPEPRRSGMSFET